MTSSLVYFEGEWQQHETGLIEAAVEQAETDCPVETHSSSTAPWIATSHTALGESGVYLASRHGLSEVLTAETAEGLARKIRQVEGGALFSSMVDAHPQDASAPTATSRRRPPGPRV